MRREVKPGVDRSLTVSEITEHFGPAFHKDCEEYKEYVLQGGNLDGWAKYQSDKKRQEKEREELRPLVKKSRFLEWFEICGSDLSEFKQEIQDSDVLELEAMAIELTFHKKYFCENQNPNNFDRLAEDLEFVAVLCREYADFMRKVKEN